jgi:nifR3 family TIM-barrel protein
MIYCEMVKMDALVRYDQGSLHMLDYDAGMHPIGAQLCGSKPQIAGKAARIVEDLGFDLVDLNCGCPVDKVTKDGSGSGMLKNPDLIGEVLTNIVAAVKIPVTVKIRAGWDEDSINAVEITKIAERAGAKAICIHARTRQQQYKGPANWNWIKACKEAASTIKVVGNGDVVDGASALQMFKDTGCDAVLIGRGTLGRPWIAEEVLSFLDGKPLGPRSQEDCRQALLEHFSYICSYHNDRRALLDMRRVGCWYVKSSSGTRSFREHISRASSLDEVRHLISSFTMGEPAEGHEEKDRGDCSEGCG